MILFWKLDYETNLNGDGLLFSCSSHALEFKFDKMDTISCFYSAPDSLRFYLIFAFLNSELEGLIFIYFGFDSFYAILF